MATLFWIVAFAAVALIVAWNFVPGFRDKMRGLSTIAEGAIAVVLYYFGLVSEGLQEAYKAGYIPNEWLVYVPVILLLWIVAKRFQTKTPVGKK